MFQYLIAAALVVFVVKTIIDHKAGAFRLSWREDAQFGMVWGSPKSLPEGWDPALNSVWVDPSCEWVIEGKMFLPVWNAEMVGTSTSIGKGGSLVEVLNYDGPSMPRGQNPAWGLVDQLASEGVDAKTIADIIFAEAAPLCWDAGPAAWGSAVKAWYADLHERIRRKLEAA